MSFLSLVLGLVLLQVWGSGGPVQRDGVFFRWQSRVSSWGLSGALGLALVVLVPSLLASWLLDVVDNVLFGLVWIALATGLLLYSFGRRDFDELVARYRHALSVGDLEGAWRALSRELQCGFDPAPDSSTAVHSRLLQGFFYEACQRWFAVVLYFLLLGPAGALAYRLLQLCRYQFESSLVERCLFFADWLPSRLLASTFTLTGNFVRCREVLVDALRDVSLPADELLTRVGVAALADDSAVRSEAEPGPAASAQIASMRSLLSRSAASWVALIALLVLID
tara:strand:+ start:2549 stop:3391 length:843 start_codon:yes stop_codon:yes gene_type:complete